MPRLLSSIRDPDDRAAVVAEHVGEEVALTVSSAEDQTFTGSLVALASVFGRGGWVAVLAYTDGDGKRRVRAFPHTTWRKIERGE